MRYRQMYRGNRAKRRRRLKLELCCHSNTVCQHSLSTDKQTKEKTIISPEPLEWAWHYHLDFTCLASRMVREYIFIVQISLWEFDKKNSYRKKNKFQIKYLRYLLWGYRSDFPILKNLLQNFDDFFPTIFCSDLRDKASPPPFFLW